MKCQSCARELPASASFCYGCGAPASGRRVSAEERKVVTVLFCDLASSSELSGLLDAELLRTIMLHYFELMRKQVETHGGIVEKFIGDAVMAIFGLVSTREDDAYRALTAAVAMMDAMAGLNGDLGRDHGLRLDIRIGVHTGQVVTTADPGSRQGLVSGEVVNIAARLEQAAVPGQVLISAATRQAAGSALKVAPIGSLALKGINEQVEAVRLIAVPAQPPDAMRRFDVPFVGRDGDLGTLDQAWSRVVAQGDAHLLTLLGEAGIGKTRLVTEWLRRHSEEIGTVGTGRCQSIGAGGSLMALADCVAPLIAELKGQTGRTDSTIGAAVALLESGVLLDGAPSPSKNETCAALMYVLTAVASERPVLLVIDECQWAEPTLIEVLNRLMEDLDRLPVMLICLARPELFDVFPAWGSGRANATTVTIAGLSADESALLAASFADVAPHERGTTDRIVAQANGNPLYLEQLDAAAHEQGASDHLPPDLYALLAARIDRLDDAERTALRYAAVIGRAFVPDDVRLLTAETEAPDDYAATLRALARRRFIAPLRTPFGAPPLYCFANIVTLRVAYEGLAKRTRSELHERYAESLVRRQCSEVLIGEHLELAYRYHAEVSMLDDRTTVLRRRAAEHLARAGTLALRRVDLPRAQALLSRAVELTDQGDPCRPEWVQQLGAACLTLGRLDEAEQALRQAIAEAREYGLPTVAAHARLLLADIRPEGGGQEKAARRALPIFTAIGDDLGLARSQLILARSCQRRGRHAKALDILDRAKAHSLSAQADQELANTLGAIGMSLWYGPDPAPTAIERCEALLAAHGTERFAVQATLGFPLTILYAAQGRFAQADERLAATHRAMTSLSYADSHVFRPLLTALVAVARDQEPAAEAALHEALDAARVLQTTGLVRTISLELARLRLMQSRSREAAELVADLEIGEDRPADLASYLGIRAWISASGADPDAVFQLADAAQAAARRTDSPTVQAVAFLDRAQATVLLGKHRSARAATEAALRRFVAKGDLSGVARTERLLVRHGLPGEKSEL
jgi:class 3 adenylate cyclase/tetratricopeptide (TPR) repeat protein